jgi:dolichol-phosphate mannosyltransferase
MNQARSLSVIIPAYNECENILATLENVTTALEPLSLPYEVLVIDDGSRDNTADLVTSSLPRFSNVRLLKNERNMGFGWSYRRGVEAASLAHVVMVHGDNAWGAATLGDLFVHVGDAEIIIGYTRDMWHSRPLMRTLISKTFTFMVNVITGRRLKYYNGLQIHRAGVLKSLTIQSTGYGFQAEVLVRALGLTKTFIEVPMNLTERERGESKAFRMKNAIDVMRTLKLLCSLEWGIAGK